MLIKNPPAQITDSLFMLGTNEYPIYLVKGKTESAIFEGGVGAMAAVLARQLRQLEVRPATVKQLIVTHAHPDHVMAVPAIRQMIPDIQVAASQAAADMLSVEKAVKFFKKVDAGLTEALIDAGSIEEQHRPQPITEKTIAIDRILKDGDKISVDYLAFDVLATPGHSDCSLSFYEPGSSILIISDATGYYIPQHNYFWPNYFTGYAAYLRSIRKLALLRTEILCLSHNAVIKGADAVKAYFDGAIASTENYHKRIVTETQNGKTPEQIAETLGEEIYEKTQLMPLPFFQKNCTLLIKQSLKHEKTKD